MQLCLSWRLNLRKLSFVLHNTSLPIITACVMINATIAEFAPKVPRTFSLQNYFSKTNVDKGS